MIVIDVGCARYGGDYSIERLIEEFKPDYFYGFDPHSSTPGDLLHLNQGKLDPKTFELLPPDGPNVWIRRAAAWTANGEIGFIEDGLNSCLTLRASAPKVPCFDLAEFIRSLPSDEKIVLKIDAEGSEYELLRHLIATRTDELLKLALVEWHCLSCGRGGGGHREECRDNTAGAAERAAISEQLGCELQEWNW